MHPRLAPAVQGIRESCLGNKEKRITSCSSSQMFAAIDSSSNLMLVRIAAGRFPGDLFFSRDGMSRDSVTYTISDSLISFI